MESTLNEWQHEWIVPSTVSDVLQIQTEIAKRIEECGFNSRGIFMSKLLMEEAFMNAVKHGNKGIPNATITISAKATRSHLELVVTDQGEGFVPEDVPDPTLEENLDKTSGRGVMLMTKMSESIEYNETGNSVKLIISATGKDPQETAA